MRGAGGHRGSLRLPIRGSAALIAGVFVAIVLCLLALAMVQLRLLAGIRAYVTGEGLWSKAQKSAVVHLSRYAESGAAGDLDAFWGALRVPLGDRRARLELERDAPDWATVRAGFVEGGNHPDDVDAMAFLFRTFRHAPWVRDAIAVWTEADAEIARLEVAGHDLAVAMQAGGHRALSIEPVLARIAEIDAILTPLEVEFSRVLSEGARFASRWFLILDVVVASLLIGAGTLCSSVLLRRIRDGELALIASETRYRELFENASDLVFTADRRACLTSMNRAAEILTGTSRHAVVGTPLERFVAPEDRARCRRIQERVLASGLPDVFETEIGTRGGTRVPVEVSLSAARDDGVIVGLQGSARDITERRRAEAALTASRRELERASAVRAEFVATMSHELRTPLNVILGYADLLLDGSFGALGDEPTEVVHRVRRSANELHELISATLDMSRLEAGRVQLDAQSVDVAALVRQVEADVSGASVGSGTPIYWHVEPSLPLLHTDPLKLKVVLKNLVRNALKFTEQGSVTVCARAAGDGVELSVADTGIGIAPEVAASIFEAFRQAADTRDKHYGGVGLGLYIVRRLLDLLGGTIRLESTPGAGSTFTVHLAPTPDSPRAAA